MNEKETKNYNVKQILAYLIIGILMIVVTIFTGNYDWSNTNFTVSNSVQNKITYTLDDIPEYTDSPYIEINNNIPDFKGEYFEIEAFETYSELDDLGRCGVAFAKLGIETMPTDDDKRTNIEHITPTAWHDDEVKTLNNNNLYNRCHLIAYSLSNENDNENNIITGTRYFNISGMSPFENQVRKYIKNNPNKHVLYRVTPIFEDDNLLASGVQIEAMSVEDNGKKLCFNVYVYNVQPGVEIDYSTGDFEEIQ